MYNIGLSRPWPSSAVGFVFCAGTSDLPVCFQTVNCFLSRCSLLVCSTQSAGYCCNDHLFNNFDVEYCLIIISWSYEFPLGIITILLRYVFCSWRNHMLLYPSSSSVQFSKTNYLPHLIHFSLHIYIHTNVDTYMFCIWKLLNIIPKQHIRNHSKTSYVLYLFDE